MRTPTAPVIVARRASERPLLLAMALSVACSGERGSAPERAGSCPPAGALAPIPPPPSGAAGRVARITSRAEVALTGPRVDARPGDYLVTHGEHVAVVSHEGKLVDYGPRGGRDEMVAIQPIVLVGLDSRETAVTRMTPVGGDRALFVERVVHGKPMVLQSFFYFEGGTLRLDTIATSTGDDPALAVTLGERLGWGNVPTWVDGQGYVARAGLYPARFAARESLGMSYAYCSSSGRAALRFGVFELPGYFETPRTGEELVQVPPRGSSPRRSVAFSYATTSLGDAVVALPCWPAADARAVAVPVELPAGARAEVARCVEGAAHGEPPAPGEPFLEYGVAARNAPIALPPGCFVIRLVAPGHEPGPWASPERLTSAGRPRAGRLRFRVTEAGLPLPARVFVRGVAGTHDPTWGTDAQDGAALNVVYADTGAGERPLPPGRYRVSVTRGFEYTAHEEEIDVVEGRSTEVAASLVRVVDTRGWLAADLHLHAVPSPDAPSPLPDRVRSLAAVGVEVAVATDHNAVTDYAPVIRELGLGGRVASVIGDEVTTRELSFGHFNVFPLAAGTAPLPYRNTLPRTIFAAAHASLPYGRETLVQVNHPRMGDIGYFELLRMDPRDVPGWLARSPLADLGFEALEVFNGDHHASPHKVEQCLADWYALLDAGYRITATGNSDSHRVSFHEAGVPRSLVATASDDPAAFDERAFVAAVRAGRVVVSSGPFVTLTAGGQPVGGTVAAGRVPVEIRVDAPPWVDVDRVELLLRGRRTAMWTFGASDLRPLVVTTDLVLAPGDWVIAIARGSRPMPHFHRDDVLPLAFTNPVWAR